jgi:hypothetical protein
MDVFLVPVGPDAYELYCEHVDEPDAHLEPDADAGELPAGFFERLRHRLNPFRLFARLKAAFHQMLLEAERDRRRGAVAAHDAGWVARVKRRSMRWVAESIAEQRLLWNLRRHETATLLFPDDMSSDAAVEVMRRQLGRDFDKHRFWLAIDSLLMVASGLLILVPGPNMIGYYFAFRVVGHFFSVRGASRGMKAVVWTSEASPALTELRGALTLDPAGRLRQAEEIASRLRLDHLATFFQRTAVS